MKESWKGIKELFSFLSGLSGEAIFGMFMIPLVLFIGGVVTFAIIKWSFGIVF